MKKILCLFAITLFAAGTIQADVAFAAKPAKKASAKKAAEAPAMPESPMENATVAAAEAPAVDCGPTQHLCKSGNRTRCVSNSQKCGPRKKKHQ